MQLQVTKRMQCATKLGSSTLYLKRPEMKSERAPDFFGDIYILTANRETWPTFVTVMIELLHGHRDCGSTSLEDGQVLGYVWSLPSRSPIGHKMPVRRCNRVHSHACRPKEDLEKWARPRLLL